MDAAELVVGLVVLEPALEVGLHVDVRRERVARGLEPGGIELREFLRHVFDGGPDLAAGLLPLLGAEAIHLDSARIVFGPDVFGDEVQLRDGDVERVALGVADLQIVFGDAGDRHLLDAVEDADAVERVDDVVSLVELVEAVESVRGVAVADVSPPVRRGLVALRDDEELRFPEQDTGTEVAGQDTDGPLREFVRDERVVDRLVTGVFEVVRQLLCGLAGARRDDGRVLPDTAREAVLLEGRERAVPLGRLAEREAVELLHRQVETAAGEVVHVDEVRVLVVRDEVLVGNHEVAERLDVLAGLEGRFEVLPVELHGAVHPLLDGTALRGDEQVALPQVAERRAGVLIVKVQVLVRAEVPAGPDGVGVLLEFRLRQVRVLRTHLFGDGPDLFRDGFRGVRLAVAGDDLRRRRQEHLVHEVRAALGLDFELRDGVDGVAPELHAQGQLPLRREEVDDAAADRELAVAFDLVRTLVAGGDEFAFQLVEGDVLPDFEVDHAGREDVRRNGLLDRGLGGDEQHVDGAEDPGGQGAAAHLFILPGTDLVRKEREVLGRQHRRLRAHGLEVLHHAGGGAFVRHEHHGAPVSAVPVQRREQRMEQEDLVHPGRAEDAEGEPARPDGGQDLLVGLMLCDGIGKAGHRSPLRFGYNR